MERARLATIWLVFAGCSLLMSMASAQTPGETPEPPREDFIDRSHERISEGVEAFISRVDGLFAGRESHDAPTGSYVRLGGDLVFRRAKHGGNDTITFIKAKIRLPRTDNRLQLIVDQGIDAITRSESQREAERVQGNQRDEDDVFLGLRGIVTETLKVSLTSDAGLRFHGLSVDPYVRGRAHRVFDLGAWSAPLSETLLWREHQGFTAATELAFLREITSSTVFSVASNATFVDRAHAWEFSEVLALSRRLEGHALLAYEAGAFGSSRPNSRVTAYTLAVRYRQQFLRDWIIGEIRPQLTFPRDRDFDLVPSLTLRLEAYFGKGQLPLP